MRLTDLARATAVVAAITFAASGVSAPADSSFEPTFRVELPQARPATFVVYGDMRFTAPTEVQASWPKARQALVAKIATESPDAVFLTGDVPWHGGVVADYDVFRAETRVWSEHGIPVYPALGNHEFAQCEEAQCLRNWWSAFPALDGRRWYSVDFSDRFLAVALDSDASLLPDSPQRQWLERQLAAVPKTMRTVMLFLHHPPSADPQTGEMAGHNVRANEAALATYLEDVAARSRLAVLVVAGHIHNYERRSSGGVVYLVSGGGGARPYPVVRDALDAYRAELEPNFHYVRLTLEGQTLQGRMMRLEDPQADAPGAFRQRDEFAISAH